LRPLSPMVISPNFFLIYLNYCLDKYLNEVYIIIIKTTGGQDNEK
jgi:hypothetical protein